MKRINLLLMLFFTFTLFGFAQEKGTEKYDSTLAQKLGADEYGMKHYVMAFLKRGPVKMDDKDKRAALQKEHLQNIMRLADEGKLILAGPFLDDTPLRGIFIFNVESVEEARKLAESDPTVKAGIMEIELHPWYGPASLIKTMELFKNIQKKGLTD